METAGQNTKQVMEENDALKVSAKYSCGFSNLMNSSMIVNGR